MVQEGIQRGWLILSGRSRALHQSGSLIAPQDQTRRVGYSRVFTAHEQDLQEIRPLGFDSNDYFRGDILSTKVFIFEGENFL